jgi:hypothetical protein
MNLIDTLKYHGRGVVLPVDELKEITRRLLTKRGVTQIVDFGAGTLFWSEFFADELGLRVSAVDKRYEKSPPDNPRELISIHTDILEVLDELLDENREIGENSEKRERRAIFICDVIHHLPPKLWRMVFAQIVLLFDVVIIKDIDCNRAIGNFCNKMHDRVINGEKINDVDPVLIAGALKKAGFAVKSAELPKLWYPHFVTAGVKGSGK